MRWQDQIGELRNQVEKTDYSSRSEVNKHNTAAAELRTIILRVANASKTEVNELLSFLHDPILGGWIAFALAELPNISDKQKDLCIEVIREIAESDGVDAMAAQWWLRDNNC